MSKYSVLVTGAAGFIGAHVAARLAQQGWRVAGCDIFNSYYDPALKRARVQALLTPLGVPCDTLDIGDLAALRDCMARHQVTHVIHLAAQAGVRHSLHEPASYLHSNLLGFGNVLQACQRQGVAHLLYASSSSVYGERTEAPFRESDRCDRPASLYAATKMANELMAHSQAATLGLPCTGLRLFTVYGPWGRPDMACMSFAQKMRRGQPITLYDGGTLWRDFTYIDDTVDAIVRLLKRPEHDSERARVFNVGHHRPVQVRDFVQALAQVLGCEPTLIDQPRPSSDVPITCADSTQLQAHIGAWSHTPLHIGLERFAHWLLAWETRSLTSSLPDLAWPRSCESTDRRPRTHLLGSDATHLPAA